MPVTLLAVDDSVTMRKVFEMTFDGESFHVVTADGADAALAAIKRDKPAMVLADITLPGKTGYDLCSAIKREYPNLPVLLMSSKLNPYDKTRGQAAKADDNFDKPFDTQKLIDRVNAMLSGDKQPAAPGAARNASPLASTLIGQEHSPSFRPQLKPMVPTGNQPSGSHTSGHTLNLRGTLDFSARNSARPAVRSAGLTPSQQAQAPAAVQINTATMRSTVSRPGSSAPVPPAISPTLPAMKTVSTQLLPEISVEGEMGQKLQPLGLTKHQVEGVLALSKDLVERVVWEVVPVLAETIIKEELKRLMEEK